MLLVTLIRASLLWHRLTEKGIVHTGCRNKQGKETLRGGCGFKIF